MCDAILFDFDGVLVDSEPLHFACWRDVAATIGLTIDWDWYSANAIGVSDREMIALFLRPHDNADNAHSPGRKSGEHSQASTKPVSEASARPDLEAALWQLFDEKKRLFAERIAADVPMPQEVRELFHELKERGIPIAVVSTSFRSEVEPALIAAGIRDCITAIVCGDDVQNLKPHPEPYLTAAKRLNATNPLVVEDSDTGAAAAKAAGFQILRVKSPSQPPSVVRAVLNL